MARRLLLADHDPAQLQLALYIIRSLDFEVYTADDGVSAFELIRKHRVQIAVLDWMLPGCSGVDVCRKLKDLPWIVHSILLTRHGTHGDLAAALEAGASDYLVKPFNPGELRARLQVAARVLELQERATRMQKMESIGQLAAGVAHEINTPAQFVNDNLLFLNDSIAHVLGALAAQEEVIDRLSRGQPVAPESIQKAQALLQDAELAYARKEIPDALAQSIDGVGRIAKIVRAMKQFSHPGSQRTLVDLNQSIESTVTVSRGEWKHLAEIELDLDPELPAVDCTPGEVNQVLLNLIVNAAHAIADVGADEADKGRIRISTRRDGERVQIAISDTGTGIAREIQGRIFDPFFTTKEVGRGTGQGLAIAYDVVVRQHGGSIEFESEPGRGTTFTIRVPIAGPGDDGPA